MENHQQALEGVTVLDLSSMVAGPFCSRLLAGFGATVIKVEQPKVGDPSRGILPLRDEPSAGWSSALFSYLNGGKKSVTLDLNTIQGRRSLLQLVKRADVVIDSFAPSQREHLKLDFELFHEANPRLVLVSISGYGQTGPNRNRKATELTLLAEGGYLRLCGDPGREPVKPYGYLAQYFAGLQAAVAATAALRFSRITGRGDVIDVSIQESISMLLGGEPTSFHLFERVYERCGSRIACSASRSSYGGNLLQCKDGHVFVSTGQNQEGLAFVAGDPVLASRELWEVGWIHGDEIDERCANWLREISRGEATNAAQEMQVAVTPLLSIEEVLTNEHLRHRGFFEKLDFGNASTGAPDRITLPGGPFQMSRSRWKTGPSPSLGEHNEEVLRDMAHEETAESGLMDRDNQPGTNPPHLMPLSHIRIVDLTQYIAGPTATLLLASLGAQVVKIERPYPFGFRRNTKVVPPPLPGVPDEPFNRVPIFNEMNRMKMSLTLDLNQEEGLQLCKDLIATSDVVIWNYTPRVMENFGLTYEVLNQINPSIIAIGISGFGLHGPWRDWVAAGPSIDATSGWAHLTGYQSGGPLRPSNYNPDLIAGVSAALAAILAILYRDRTGDGQFVDVSMLDSTLQFMGEAVVATSAGLDPHGRNGNRSLTGAPSGCYPCREPDSWIALENTSDSEWDILCEAMGRADLRVDPSFQSSFGRQEHHGRLDALLSEWTSAQSADELCQRLAEQGLAVGVLKSSRELIPDAHLKERGFFQLLQEPQAGPVLYSRFGWTFDKIPDRFGDRAPSYGEHNSFVLRDLLGLTDQKINHLEQSGVIAGPAALSQRG